MSAQDYTITPIGTRIVGTRETVPATAYVENFRPGPGGTLSFDHTGETEVHWDWQESDRDDDGDRIIFIDNAGDYWVWDTAEQTWEPLD